MYCKKCGKEIDYEAEVCNECAEAVAVEEVAPAAAVAADGKNPKLIGLGKAITSLLLPIIGMFAIGLIAGFISVIANDLYTALAPYIENPELLENEVHAEAALRIIENFMETDLMSVLIGGILLLVAGGATFIMSIVGIILGIQSIKCFVNENKKGNKPIATLVVGILGLVESASAFISIAGTVCIIAAAVAMFVL